MTYGQWQLFQSERLLTHLNIRQLRFELEFLFQFRTRVTLIYIDRLAKRGIL